MAAPSLSELGNVTAPSSAGGHTIQSQRRALLAALQHEVTAAANSAQSFEVALRQALPHICMAFGWPAAHAFTMAERELILLPTQIWHIASQDGLARLSSVRAEPLGFNPAAQAIAVESLASHDAPRAVLARELGLSHIINVTVPAGPQLGGLIEFFCSNPLELDEDEREALSDMAAHLGQVLERERYLSALLRSEARFRAIFDSNVVPMYFWNWENKLIFDANEPMLRLLGFTREEMERGEMRCTGLTPEDQQEKTAEAIERLRRGEHSPPYEKNWMRRDGSLVSVVVGGALLPGSRNVGTAIAVDVTELRRTASTLRESERRYQLATSAALVSIWELDLETDMVYSDGILSEILGYPRDEQVPHEMWIGRIHRADRERVLQHEQSVLSSPERLPDGATPISPIEFRIFSKQRRVHWFLNRGLLLRDAHGNAYRATGAITDITEQKRVQQLLSRQQRQLQSAYRRVRNLTGRLIHTQEQERTRIARELHDDLGQRLASLAISLAQIRRQSTGNDELFAKAEREVDELAKAMRDLSHNLHSAVLEHAGLEAAVRSLAEELQSTGDLRVTLTFTGLPATIPNAISLAAYRIIQEGLRNVQKHSGAGHAKLYITATDSQLLVQVHDDGRGFTVWNHNGRTGLGLISAAERARLVGGKFSVSSTPGRGTHLCAILPLDSGDQSEAA